MDNIEKAYTQHAQDVYRYLLSLAHDEELAEELTQETFFRAMRTIGNYDGSCKLSVELYFPVSANGVGGEDKNADIVELEIREVERAEGTLKSRTIYRNGEEVKMLYCSLTKTLRERILSRKLSEEGDENYSSFICFNRYEEEHEPQEMEIYYLPEGISRSDERLSDEEFDAWMQEKAELIWKSEFN